MKETIHNLLIKILDFPKPRIKRIERPILLRRILEQNGCEVKDKVTTHEYQFKAGGICDRDRTIGQYGALLNNAERVFKRQKVNDLSDEVDQFNAKFKTTLIENQEQATEYLNRRKEIEGIPPINLHTMQREWKEKNTPHVKN